MEDLSRELSISKKTLYAHFGDKRKMIQMIVAAQVDGDKECCQVQIQEAKNAIDEMFRVTSFVTERLKNVNVTFFYDLRMSFPKAFQTMEDYKRGFIQETILQNLNRGIKEGVYRQDLKPQIVAHIYLSNVEMVFGGREFDAIKVSPYEIFIEIFMLHMRGIVSESGLQLLIEHFEHVTKN